MPTRHPRHSVRAIGLLGLGAFGRLIVKHLSVHFDIVAHDPAAASDEQDQLRLGSIADVGRCDLVILAVPVRDMATAVASLAPHLRPGTIVVDVGSVKVVPTRVMLAGLPPWVDIVGTHPLFGPQSAKAGIRGRKIAICPVRGRPAALHIAAFLRAVLGLQVFLTSPEDHDREAAHVQGLTHLIAKVLVAMEPLPRRLTTASFDHLMQATEMVRYDAASVFEAIERDNPFAADVRERFFDLAAETRARLERRVT